MTTYYKGNNIGLSYNAEAGTWSFNNTPQDFIDPNAFSTPDPKFPTAPTTPTTPTTPTEPEQDPCPAGYIYDNSLKQCVPDPNYQNPFRQDNNQGPREEPGIPGTGRELPSKFSSEGGLFPYSTDAPTRAQQNEHMLLMDGVSKGWLVDNGQGQYIKQPFKDKQLPGIGWAGMAMKYFNEKSYDDYFKILENGWNAERDANLWTKWVPRSGGYSLVGGMKRSSTAVGGIGDDKERIVEYYGYSEGFQDKVNQAKSITNGMIDRDGNVNVNTGQGSYYREDGKFVDKYGQVSASGSLSNALKLLKQANLVGGLPSNLKARLLKGITTKALSDEERNKLAQDAGFKNIEDAITELNKVKTKITEQQKRDEPKQEPEKTVTDPSKIGDNVTTSVGGIITEGDKISDDGRGIITDSSGDTYTPTSDGQGYTFKSDDPKPSVQQPISKGSTQTYGAGRGGTASQQQEMKKQDTRNNNFSPQDRNIQPAKPSKGYSGPAFGRR